MFISEFHAAKNIVEVKKGHNNFITSSILGIAYLEYLSTNLSLLKF